MWLDRLANAGSSSPQPNSRTASPLPRRPAGPRGPYVTSQRSARGSSVSLVSNNSSSSLLASARKPNGSALKQSTIADDGGTEAVEVLNKLLGSASVGDAPEEKVDAPITEEDLGVEFDFGGLSLRALAQAGVGQTGLDVYRSQTIK